MLFNSFDFLIFFPIVVLVLLIVPKRIRNIWLLLVSYYFYMCWNPQYGILIVLSTAISFFCGILIERLKFNSHKKGVVAFVVIANLGVLVFFKYTNFILDTISKIAGCFDVTVTERRLDLLMPIGISFYTFQVLGYLFDVYNKKIRAERNILTYALFVSFFPHLVAGPIERASAFLEQIHSIKQRNLLNFDRIRDGLILIFWGLFQKMVIADRAAMLVNKVYGNYLNYGFVELAIASLLFSVQIYCDFCGYTNMARGVARVMGFELVNNFRQPYLATSIKEFWRRWHISLTSWFTDYVYIPLGGNRKGTIRKYLNISIVFGLSGLWHGASWNYVAWGLIHATWQVIGDIKAHVLKSKNAMETFSRRVVKQMITFTLVNFAWIFFAANSVRVALGICKQMVSTVVTTSLYEIGLDKENWQIMVCSIVVLICVDVMSEKGFSLEKSVNSQSIWLKMLLYLALVWSVIMFGIYGVGYDTSQFIYVQF